MKKFFLFMAAAATAMTLGLSSCHSGDDDDDRAVVDDNERSYLPTFPPKDGRATPKQVCTNTV